MQHNSKILSIVISLLIVFSLVAPVFASGTLALQGIDAFTALYNAYLVAHGLEAVGYTDNNAWSDNAAASNATWRELWEENFNYYAPLVDQTITDVNTWWQNHRIYMGTGYIDNNGDYHNGSPNNNDPDAKLGISWSSHITEFFDKFTNLIFKDQYSLVNDGSGFVHSSGSFDSPLVTSYTGWPLCNINMSVSQIFAIGKLYGSGSTSIYNGAVTDESVMLFAFQDNNKYYPVTVTIEGGTRGIVSNGNSNWNQVANTGIVYNNTTYYYSNDRSLYFDLNQLAPYVMIFSSINDAVEYYDAHYTNGVVNNTNFIRLVPENNDPIPVPDTDDLDYSPEPAVVGLDIPYSSSFSDPDFTDSTDPAANSIIDAVTTEVSTNTLSTLNPDTPLPPVESPSPVMPPFLPSDPPSFNFNFSGIWYYVVRWVNSIRSGLGFFSVIWSNIPPAMFYPVYASAVVVIVLGVWKRFFA